MICCAINGLAFLFSGYMASHSSNHSKRMEKMIGKTSWRYGLPDGLQASVTDLPIMFEFPDQLILIDCVNTYKAIQNKFKLKGLRKEQAKLQNRGPIKRVWHSATGTAPTVVIPRNLNRYAPFLDTVERLFGFSAVNVLDAGKRKRRKEHRQEVIKELQRSWGHRWLRGVSRFFHTQFAEEHRDDFFYHELLVNGLSIKKSPWRKLLNPIKWILLVPQFIFITYIVTADWLSYFHGQFQSTLWTDIKDRWNEEKDHSSILNLVVRSLAWIVFFVGMVHVIAARGFIWLGSKLIEAVQSPVNSLLRPLINFAVRHPYITQALIALTVIAVALTLAVIFSPPGALTVFGVSFESILAGFNLYVAPVVSVAMAEYIIPAANYLISMHLYATILTIGAIINIFDRSAANQIELMELPESKFLPHEQATKTAVEKNILLGISGSRYSQNLFNSRPGSRPLNEREQDNWNTFWSTLGGGSKKVSNEKVAILFEAEQVANMKGHCCHSG